MVRAFPQTLRAALFAALIALVLLPVHFNAMAVTPMQPSRDDDVLEVLPAITRTRPVRNVPASAASGTSSATPVSPPKAAEPTAAAAQSREDIAVARQTGDTRYWEIGRAHV